MKKIVWLIVLFLLALAIANLSQLSGGNVIIYLAKYRLSFSLNFLITIWVVSFFLFWLFFCLIRGTFRLPFRFGLFFSNRKKYRLEKLYTRYLLDYCAGKYQELAKKLPKLCQQLPKDDKNSILLFIAADSLFQVNSPKINDLAAEFTNCSDSGLLAKLMQARILIHNQQYAAAKGCLDEAIVLDMKNIAAYRLQLDVCLILNDLQTAKNCFLWLTKHKLMPAYLQNHYQQCLGIAH